MIWRVSIAPASRDIHDRDTPSYLATSASGLPVTTAEAIRFLRATCEIRFDPTGLALLSFIFGNRQPCTKNALDSEPRRIHLF